MTFRETNNRPQKAISVIRKHVTPLACFVWYVLDTGPVLKYSVSQPICEDVGYQLTSVFLNKEIIPHTQKNMHKFTIQQVSEQQVENFAIVLMAVHTVPPSHIVINSSINFSLFLPHFIGFWHTLKLGWITEFDALFLVIEIWFVLITLLLEILI